MSTRSILLIIRKFRIRTIQMYARNRRRFGACGLADSCLRASTNAKLCQKGLTDHRGSSDLQPGRRGHFHTNSEESHHALGNIPKIWPTHVFGQAYNGILSAVFEDMSTAHAFVRTDETNCLTVRAARTVQNLPSCGRCNVRYGGRRT